MTITVTAPVTLADVMIELRTTNAGRAYPISLGDADVRSLAGVPSGAISLSNLLGKSAYTPMSGSVPDVPGATAAIDTANNYFRDVSVAVSVTGGQAPFSYAWSRVSGDIGTTVIAANAASTSVRFTVNKTQTAGAVLSAVAQCIVTDATAATLTRSGTVTLTLT